MGRVADFLGLSARPPQLRALTASASRLDTRDSPYYLRMSQPWQLRALTYYDAIGEIRFASQFYAKLISRVRYYPALLHEDGTVEPITSGPPVKTLSRIQDPGGGTSRLQYDYGRLMGVTGEGVLFQREDEETEDWRFLWKDEVRRAPNGGWERVRADKTSYDPPQYGTAYRLWTPHPRHSDEADSPLRSVLNIAEELLALTDSVMSTTVTRRTNGVFVIPTELSPSQYGPPGDDDYLGDEDPRNNPFLSDWIEHNESSIENFMDARAKIPFMLEGGYEYIDRVRWIQTYDPQMDYMERELRTEAVKRLALGMDFPPEFLLGMTDANHWTARQVVYDMWRSYGSPVAERFGDDLSEVFLRPALREEGYKDWSRVVVAFDDSQVVVAPDRTEDADKALDRAAISWEAYLELKGFPKSYAPSPEEQAVLIAMRQRQPIVLEGNQLMVGERGPVAAPSNGNSPEDGPPAPTGGREGSRQEARTASARILGAAEDALMRCRDLAGRRIQQRCEECGEGEPLSVVASAIGPSADLNPVELVKGGADHFSRWLVEQGIDAKQADSLQQQLEVYAARTLFQPRCPGLPSGFVAAIEKAREVSHALAD